MFVQTYEPKLTPVEASPVNPPGKTYTSKLLGKLTDSTTSHHFNTLWPTKDIVGEISQSKVNFTADDDEGLKKVTEIKEGIKNEEKNRYDEILLKIPDGLKENKKIQSQSIFGARGYSISHYARVVRADLLALNSEMKRSSFISRIFPKDLEHILSELPTDILIIKN